jgi:hypothetical protein
MWSDPYKYLATFLVVFYGWIECGNWVRPFATRLSYVTLLKSMYAVGLVGVLHSYGDDHVEENEK